MKGILKEVKRIECKTKEGKKFSLIEFKADVTVNDKGDVKTLRGSYGEEFARKYFTYCGTKTKDLIGKPVDCVIAKKSIEKEDGTTLTISYIKYLNVIGEDGKPIYLPKEDNADIDF